MDTTEQPRYHVFAGMHRRWGHNYTVLRVRDDGREFSLMGHGGDDGLPRVDDVLLLDHGIGGHTRYRVTSIEVMKDPPDHWFAEVEWIAPSVEGVAPTHGGVL